jgi:hypothetical protein
LDLPWQNAGDAACWGVGATAALFIGIGLFFGVKAALASLARWIAEQRQANREG